MRILNRREFLKIGGISSLAGLSGCLRLSQNDDTGETVKTDDTGVTAETRGSGGTYEVRKFRLNNFDQERDALEGAGELSISAENGDTISGEWTGNSNIARSQACARYSFEIVGNDSVIASTGQKVLIIAYQYAFRQTTSSVFLTYQPSVRPDWDLTLRLSYPNGEYTMMPTIQSDKGVFGFDLSNSGIESGRYEWVFQVTPPDSPTIDIGRFNDRLVSVKPDDDSQFPSRSEAIETVGSLSNPSSTPVEPPAESSSTGLNITSIGHSGGSIDGTRVGQEISRGASVNCEPSYTMGPNRQFRINNLTTGETLTFEPN